MSLKKPPLAEVWVSFQFEPAPGAPPWDRERYQAFFDRIGQSHPNVEHMAGHQIHVVRSKSGGKPRIENISEHVVAMRAFTEDRLRVVQLMQDLLTVNYLRGNPETDPYPGFAALLDEAMIHCREYADCFRPLGVTQVALHYVDLVEFPIPQSRILNTADYFTLDLHVPDRVFGPLLTFDIKLQFMPADGGDAVELAFATEPTQKDATHRRYRLEWHTAARPASRLTDDEIRANLQIAHDRLKMCFQNIFTPKAWALFEPETP